MRPSRRVSSFKACSSLICSIDEYYKVFRAMQVSSAAAKATHARISEAIGRSQKLMSESGVSTLQKLKHSDEAVRKVTQIALRLCSSNTQFVKRSARLQ